LAAFTRWRLRPRDEHGLLLSLILISLIRGRSHRELCVGKVLADVLLAAVALFALRTSGARPRAMRLASIAVGIVIIISAVSAAPSAVSALAVDEVAVPRS